MGLPGGGLLVLVQFLAMTRVDGGRSCPELIKNSSFLMQSSSFWWIQNSSHLNYTIHHFEYIVHSFGHFSIQNHRFQGQFSIISACSIERSYTRQPYEPIEPWNQQEMTGLRGTMFKQQNCTWDQRRFPWNRRGNTSNAPPVRGINAGFREIDVDKRAMLPPVDDVPSESEWPPSNQQMHPAVQVIISYF